MNVLKHDVRLFGLRKGFSEHRRTARNSPGATLNHLVQVRILVRQPSMYTTLRGFSLGSPWFCSVLAGSRPSAKAMSAKIGGSTSPHVSGKLRSTSGTERKRFVEFVSASGRLPALAETWSGAPAAQPGRRCILESRQRSGEHPLAEEGRMAPYFGLGNAWVHEGDSYG